MVVALLLGGCTFSKDILIINYTDHEVSVNVDMVHTVPPHSHLRTDTHQGNGLSISILEQSRIKERRSLSKEEVSLNIKTNNILLIEIR